MSLPRLIVVVDKDGSVHHLSNLLQLALHKVMLLPFKGLYLLHLILLLSLSLRVSSVRSATISLALSGPGCIDSTDPR